MSPIVWTGTETLACWVGECDAPITPQDVKEAEQHGMDPRSGDPVYCRRHRAALRLKAKERKEQGR